MIAPQTENYRESYGNMEFYYLLRYTNGMHSLYRKQRCMDPKE